MKRFSKVVRHPHKLAQWLVGTKETTNYKKQKVDRMYCDELSLARLNRNELSKSKHLAKEVLESWNALQHAQNNVDTLMNLLEVLLNTCVCPCECVSEVAKPEGDIRSLLCDKSLVAKLLISLTDHWEAAIEMLDLTETKRKQLLTLKPLSNKLVSPELLTQFGWTSGIDETEIASSHLCELMPWLHEQDQMTARILCDDWERLPVKLHGKVLFAYSNALSLRTWFDVLLTLDIERSRNFIWILLRNDVDQSVVIDHVAPLMCYAYYQQEKLNYKGRVTRFVQQLIYGVGVDRLSCLTEIERHLDQQSSCFRRNSLGLTYFDAIEPLLKLELLDADSIFDLWSGNWINSYWEYAIERMQHYALDKATSECFVKLLVSQVNYLGEKEDFILWYIDAAASALKATEKTHLEKMSHLLYIQFDGGDSLDKAQLMLTIAKQVCVAKMSKSKGITDVISEIEDVSAEKQFIDEMQVHGWRHLDQYCRSENRCELLVQGLDKTLSWGSEYISTFISGINLAPTATLEAISSISRLSNIEVRDFKQWLEYHPLTFCQQETIFQRCILVEHLKQYHPSVSLPKKLIRLAMLENGDFSTLRNDVRNKEEEILTTAEMRMLAASILEYVETNIASKIDYSGLDTHTVAFIGSTDSNKRGAKKALRNYQQKGDVARLLHPSNIHWLKKPKSFWRPAVWIKGFKMTTELEKIGEVTIETESRFEEILKMGTYVNSCLSMGGCNQHSAIANVLDANKRVLFMRDMEGKFIARQLLAITKERKLACFEVYHSGHQYDKEVIKSSFAKADLQLAEALGVTIQEESSYEIENIVCRDWYDDGIWNIAEESTG